MKRLLPVGLIGLFLAVCCWSIAAANDSHMNVSVNPPVPFETEVGNIRMESEHISIYFGKSTSRIEVEFTFRNVGDSFEYAVAGFPDENLLFQSIYDELGPNVHYSPLEYGFYTTDGDRSVIDDFMAWTRPAGLPEEQNVPLDFDLVRSIRESIEIDNFPDGEWKTSGVEAVYRTFQLNIGPGDAVVVGISYSTPNGGNAMGEQYLFYTLKTGANWAGTIGDALVDLYTIDGLSHADLSLEQGDGWAVTSPGREHWNVVDDTHLQMRITDFDPVGIYSGLFIVSRSMTFAEMYGESNDENVEQEDLEANEEK